MTPDAQEQEFRVSSDHSLKYIVMYPRQGLRCFFPLQGKCQWKIRALIMSLDQADFAHRNIDLVYSSGNSVCRQPSADYLRSQLLTLMVDILKAS